MTHSTSWHQSPVVTDYDIVLTLRMMMTWREARSRHATCIHHCTCPGGQKYGQSAIIDVTAAEGSGNGGKFRILRSILIIAGCLFICLHRCPHHNMSRCEYKYYLLNTLINRKYLILLKMYQLIRLKRETIKKEKLEVSNVSWKMGTTINECLIPNSASH